MTWGDLKRKAVELGIADDTEVWVNGEEIDIVTNRQGDMCLTTEDGE